MLVSYARQALCRQHDLYFRGFGVVNNCWDCWQLPLESRYKRKIVIGDGSEDDSPNSDISGQA